jgi:hypothetical protein
MAPQVCSIVHFCLLATMSQLPAMAGKQDLACPPQGAPASVVSTCGLCARLAGPVGRPTVARKLVRRLRLVAGAAPLEVLAVLAAGLDAGRGAPQAAGEVSRRLLQTAAAACQGGCAHQGARAREQANPPPFHWPKEQCRLGDCESGRVLTIHKNKKDSPGGEGESVPT